MSVPTISSPSLYGWDDVGEVARALTITQSGSKYQLDVSSTVAAVTEVNLDETDDEVAVFGGVNGSETADDSTRQIINVDSSGRVRTTPVTGALTDRSGSITSGDTSQQLMAANTSRVYLFVHNISAEDLWIDFGTAAVKDQPSIKLVSEASFVMEGSFVSTQAINIIGATTGSKFTAKEGG